MGKKTEKGKKGNVAQYLTRNQAMKRLQLKLGDFRRLCILKGVHPREPKKKPHGQNKSYYHIKDINFLLHEPVLQTMRDIRAHERKIKKALGRKNDELAERLMNRKPGYRLDHLVRERYPSFIDAIRDMDDALSMVFLFASLPSSDEHGIPDKAVRVSRQLALEFQAYCVRAHALRRAFISVKGVYFQAQILGQDVTWIVPHQLVQLLPSDVDYRVMLTFLEFYQTFLKFVHFKLYADQGLKYPPVLDPRLDEAASGVEALMHDIARRAAAKRIEQGATGEGPAGTDGAEDAGAGEGAMEERRRRMRELKRGGAAVVARGDGEGSDSGESEGGEGGEGGEEGEESDGVAAGSSDEEEGDAGDGATSDGEGEGDSAEDEDEDGSVEIDSGDEEDDSSDDEDGEGESGGDKGGADADAGALDPANRGAEAGSREAEDGDETAGKELAVARVGGGAAVGEDDAAVCSSLFRGLVFWISREVSRDVVAFVVRSFGGVACWDGEGSPHGRNDECITHEVVDRPQQGHQFFSRTYVQPQWVFDSANFRILAPASMYAPGKVPPPHLSPFVNDEEEGYTPDFAKVVKKLQQQAAAARKQGLAPVTAEVGVEDEDMTLPGPVRAAPVAEEERFQAELREELQVAGAGAGKKRGHAASEGGTPDLMEEAEEDAEALEDAKKGLMTSRERKFLHRINESRRHKRARVEQLMQRKKELATK